MGHCIFDSYNLGKFVPPPDQILYLVVIVQIYYFRCHTLQDVVSEAEYEELDLHKVAVDIPKMKSTYLRLHEPRDETKVHSGLFYFNGVNQKEILWIVQSCCFRLEFCHSNQYAMPD